MTRIFSVLFIKSFTKNYRTISEFSSIFSPKVNSVFCFVISDFYPKTKRYLYLKKNVKKAQGIIFHGVKTGQCMSHVSTKIKRKHEVAIYENKRARGRHKGKGYTIATLVFRYNKVDTHMR